MTVRYIVYARSDGAILRSGRTPTEADAVAQSGANPELSVAVAAQDVAHISDVTMRVDVGMSVLRDVSTDAVVCPLTLLPDRAAP